MFGHANTYKKKLDKIENDEEALKKELRDVRSTYNLFKGFDLKLIVPFFGGFVISAFKISTFESLYWSLFAFSTVVFVMLVLACVSNIFYERMKLVKAELKKINNTVKPNSKKISVRIYNRNLVRRSNFGR